jgi:hypothetical protein
LDGFNGSVHHEAVCYREIDAPVSFDRPLTPPGKLAAIAGILGKFLLESIYAYLSAGGEIELRDRDQALR